MIGKRYALPADAIRPLATGHGGCIATYAITVDGLPVRFLYREAPDNDADCGWRFTSGVESDACMEDPENHGIVEVNTIACTTPNRDPSIIPFLDARTGSAFEKRADAQSFVPVGDWEPPED